MTLENINGLNTFGFHSINYSTFNIRDHADEFVLLPHLARDIIVTVLKIYNAVFKVLGYMVFVPLVPLISGCIRMGVGVIIIAATLFIPGLVTGHLYREALITGIAQIARGALEAFVPFGWAVNLALDVTATPFNILQSTYLKNLPNDCRECLDFEIENGRPKHLLQRPLADPLYDNGAVFYLLNTI